MAEQIQIILVATIATLNFMVGVFLLVFGFYTRKKKDRSWAPLYFGVLTISTAIWGASQVVYGFFRAFPHPTHLVLPFLIYFFPLMVPPALLGFAETLGTRQYAGWQKYKWWLIPVLPFALFMMIPGIGAIEFSEPQLAVVRFGSLSIYAYLAYVLLFFIAGFRVLIQKMIKAETQETRSLVRMVFVILLVTALLTLTTNLVIPIITQGVTGVSPLMGPLSTAILVGGITYLMSQYDLFDIKKVYVEVLVIVGLVLLVIVTETLLSLTVSGSPLSETLVIIVVFGAVAFVLTRGIIQGVEDENILRRVNTKLQDSIEEKNTFLQVTSHQLRTPLTAIKGYTDLIQGDDDYIQNMNISSKGLMNQIEVSGLSISSIVADLLMVNSLSSGKFTLNAFAQVDLGYVVQNLVREKHIAIEEKGMSLNVDLVGKDHKVKGDELKLKEMMNNLIDNAIQYCDTKVEIRVKSRVDSVEVRIKDDGIGIPKKEQKKIFRLHERGSNAQELRTIGTGLGLYLAKTIVTKHKGTIEVASQGVGKGSTFTITLPRE